MTEQQNLKPCPFCGSQTIDPEGWASTARKGPACDECGSSADTVAEWNTRPEEDRLRATLKGVEIALARDGDLDAAMKLIVGEGRGG